MKEIILVSHGFQINYERGFTNGLAANCDCVTLISSDRTDRKNLSHNINDVNLRGSQEEGRSKWQKIRNLARYHLRLLCYVLLSRQSNVHVIGLIEPAILFGVIEGLFFRLFSKKYILTVHNIVPHGRDTKSQRSAYRLAYKVPHQLIVHTEKMRAQLIETMGVPAEKITVMEHGIEPMHGDVSIESNAHHSAVKHKVKVLFFGKVVHYKGLDILLDALQPLAGRFELLIAGSTGDRSLYDAINSRILSHPACSDIRWRNEFIPEDEVGAIFKGADLLVLPYRHIDQSGVLFQALRYGLPILATDVGAFPEYVNSTCGLLCKPEDVEGLTKSLQQFFDTMPNYCRVKIQQEARKYEWPSIIKSIFDKVYL